MTDLLLIVLIVLVIYDIILTVQIDNLRTDMSNVKKFLYSQYNINLENAELFKNLHTRVKKLEDEEFFCNIDYDPDLLNKGGGAV